MEITETKTNELFNIDNPYYQKWKPGRPSKVAIEKRKKYWEFEKNGISSVNYDNSNPRSPLFKHMLNEHNRILLDSEMDEIITICKNIKI